MTVHKGTMDVRNRVFSTNTLDWEPQSTGSAGGPGGSTQVSIKEILSSSGGSIIDSSAVALRVSGTFSADTVVSVSSVGGVVKVGPTDTNFASSAGFHFEASSGALLVGPGSTVWAVQLSQYSTTAQVSSVGGLVAVRPSDTNWASSAGFHFDSSGGLLTNGGGGGSTQVSIKEILTSSGASVMDSTAGAIKVNVVAGSAAGDTTVTVTPAAGSTFRTNPGSTLWASSAGFHFTSSGGLQSVVNVDDVVSSGTISSTGSFTVELNGHHACGYIIENGTLDAIYTVEASGDGGSSWGGVFYLNAGLQKLGNSSMSSPNAQTFGDVLVGTGWSHCRLRIHTYASGSARVHMRATMLTSPLAFDGITMGINGSAAPSFSKMIGGRDASGVAQMARMSTNYQLPGDTAVGVRETIPNATSVGGFSSASGDLTLISSSADALYVYAYTMQRYSSVLNTIRLMDGSTALGWFVSASGINGGGTGSTGTTNDDANQLAVTPPAYLFRTSTGNPLVLSRSSTGHFSYAVSAFRVR